MIDHQKSIVNLYEVIIDDVFNPGNLYSHDHELLAVESNNILNTDNIQSYNKKNQDC